MGCTKVLAAFDALLPALVLTCVHGDGGAHSTAPLSLALTIVSWVRWTYSILAIEKVPLEAVRDGDQPHG